MGKPHGRTRTEGGLSSARLSSAFQKRHTKPKGRGKGCSGQQGADGQSSRRKDCRQSSDTGAAVETQTRCAAAHAAEQSSGQCKRAQPASTRAAGRAVCVSGTAYCGESSGLTMPHAVTRSPDSSAPPGARAAPSAGTKGRVAAPGPGATEGRATGDCEQGSSACGAVCGWSAERSPAPTRNPHVRGGRTRGQAPSA